MTFPYSATHQLLQDAIASKQGSALAIAVAQGDVQRSAYYGVTAFPSQSQYSQPVDATSLFDLASLTKVLVTVPLVIEAVAEKRLQLSDPVQKFVPAYPHASTTVDHLLRHRSGLAAHRKFYEEPAAKDGIQRQDLLRWICESSPGEPETAATVYSDLGMLLLGHILETVEGAEISTLFHERMQKPLGLRHCGFRALEHASSKAQALRLQAPQAQFVATAACPTHGRVLQGEVDDNNAWAVGGVAPHAGLFANLEDTLTLFRLSIRHALREPELYFPDADSTPPFKRGYMLYPGLRPIETDEWQGAIGHTGFVGTSAWYHRESDTYVILLGNRVHPDREDKRWIETRLQIHAQLWQDLGLG